MDRKVLSSFVLLALGAVGIWLAIGGERTPEVASVDESTPTKGGPALAGREAPPMETGDALLTGHVWRGGARVDAHVELAWVEAVPDVVPWHYVSDGERLVMDGAAALRAGGRSKTSTAADGFAFQLASGGRYALRASVEGAAAVLLFFDLPAGQAKRQLHVVLPAGEHALAVHVQDVFEKPVRASVFLRGDVLPEGAGRGFAVTGPVPTSAAGHAAFEGLDAGTARVFARVGTLEIASPRLAVPRDRPVLLTVPSLDAPLTIEARDGDTEALIASGEVRVEGQMPDGTSWVQEGRIHDGVATALGASVAVSVTVEAPGYATTTVHAGRAERSVSVRLFETPRVTGTVVHAATGAPVPHVRVSFVEMWRGEIGRFDQPRHVRTDARGAFTIRPLRWGRSMVWVHDKGLVREGLARVTKTVNPCVVDVRAQVVEGVTLRVGPAARVEGVIQTLDGEPLEGVELYLDQTRIEEERISGSFDFEDFFRRTAHVVEAKSDAKGAFVFPTLIPTWPWSGYASKAGYEITPELSITPAAGSTTTLTLRAKPVEVKPVAKDENAREGAFVVRVHGEDGRPLPGATVAVTSQNARDADLPPILRTGPSGVLRLEGVARKILWFDASAPGHAALRARARPEDDSITLRLSRGLFVTGTALLPDGTPAVGAEMTAVAREDRGDEDRPGWSREVRTSLTPTWEPDGTFRAGPLASGRHVLEVTCVRAGQRYFAAETITAGSATRIQLSEAELPEPRFGGPGMLVVRGPGGEKLGRATLHDYSLAGGKNGWPTMWGMTNGVHEMPDDDYPFWIDVVRPVLTNGRYARYGEIRLGPYRAGEGPDSLEVQLPPEKTIAGRVLLPSGDPAAGCLVEAFTAPPEGYSSDQTWISSNAFTDRDGRFLLRQLGSLDYDIKVKPQAGTTAARVRAAAGAQDVTVRLGATLDVTVTVLDPGERPVAGVAVVLTDPDASHFVPADVRARAETDADGRAVLRALDPNRSYGLRCEVSKGRDDLHPYTKDRWKPLDTTVRLAGAHELTGRVTLPDGTPIHGVRVSFQPQAEDDTSGFARKTDAKGVFALPRVPAGRGILTLWQPGMRAGAWTREIRVPPAARLDLVLDPGRTLQVHVGTPSSQVQSVILRLLAVDTAGKRLGSIWSAAPGVGATVPFYGLHRNQRHALFALVHKGDEQFAAWVPDIPADATELTIPWRPALATQLLVDGPGPIQKGWKRIQILDPAVDYQRGFKGDRTTLHLPAGTWRIRLRMRSGGDEYATERDIQAGGTHRLTLERK